MEFVIHHQPQQQQQQQQQQQHDIVWMPNNGGNSPVLEDDDVVAPTPFRSVAMRDVVFRRGSCPNENSSIDANGIHFDPTDLSKEEGTTSSSTLRRILEETKRVQAKKESRRSLMKATTTNDCMGEKTQNSNQEDVIDARPPSRFHSCPATPSTRKLDVDMAVCRDPSRLNSCSVINKKRTSLANLGKSNSDHAIFGDSSFSSLSFNTDDDDDDAADPTEKTLDMDSEESAEYEVNNASGTTTLEMSSSSIGSINRRESLVKKNSSCPDLFKSSSKKSSLRNLFARNDYDKETKNKKQRSSIKNLTLAAAKEVWNREWLTMTQRLEDGTDAEFKYVLSSFDDDLSQSLRHSLQRQSSGSTIASEATERSTSRRLDFTGNLLPTITKQNTQACLSANDSICYDDSHVEDFEDEYSYDLNELSGSTPSPLVGQSRRPSVKFTTITIQEYGMIPGDSPAGTCGVPVTIGWVPYDPVTVDLQSYERWRVPNRRIHRQEMQMPSYHRRKILEGLGFGSSELKAAAKEAAILRKRRRESLHNMRMDKTHERIELVTRCLYNLFTCGTQMRKEHKLLVESYRYSVTYSQKGCPVC